MTNLNTIQQDTAELLPDEQQLVFDLIELLRKRTRSNQSKSTYQKFVESGLIGCVEIEEDLSTTYKQVLAQELAKKYDHR
jgi:hypothetical protein